MSIALVTGSAGFIGTHLVEVLWEAGWDVKSFDLKDGQDIRARDRLPEADWCFHLAALTDARSDDCEAMIQTNVIGTQNVLKQFGPKTIFTSSSAINYPFTPYAISKLTCEHLCTMHGARTVRLCNIWGEGGHGVFEKFKAQEILEVAGLGDQIRTYAYVGTAVDTLIDMVKRKPGDLHVLRGIDLTVNEIIEQNFKDKPYKRVPRAPTDIIDGRQI